MTIFLDDIEVGQHFVSSGRSVTETDIVSFAGISGDFNPLHMDEVWVRANTDYPGRVAHGMLVLSITTGLRTQDLDDWMILAFLNVERKMAQPVFPGDRIHMEATVESVRPSRSKPGVGVVVNSVQVFNEAGETVQSGFDTYLVAGRVQE